MYAASSGPRCGHRETRAGAPVLLASTQGRREARWVQADRGVRPGDMRWRKTFWLALAARDRPAEQPALRCSLLRVHLAAWQQPDCAWLGSTRL